MPNRALNQETELNEVSLFEYSNLVILTFYS